MHLLDSSDIAFVVFVVIGLVAAAAVIVAVARDGYGQVPDRNTGFETASDRGGRR